MLDRIRLQALPSLAVLLCCSSAHRRVDGGDPTRHHRQPDRLAGRGLPTGERVAGSGGHGWRTTYAYTWSNGTTGPLNNRLVAGNYTVTVVDGNLDQAQQTYTVGNDSPWLPFSTGLSGTGWTCQLSGFVLGRVPGDRDFFPGHPYTYSEQVAGPTTSVTLFSRSRRFAVVMSTRSWCGMRMAAPVM